MGKSTLSSFDSKAWKRSRPLVTEIQGLTEMSGVLLSLDVFSFNLFLIKKDYINTKLNDCRWVYRLLNIENDRWNKSVIQFPSN